MTERRLRGSDYRGSRRLSPSVVRQFEGTNRTWRCYRENLVHGVLVFVDSLIAWLGMCLLAVGCSGSLLPPLLISVGAFLVWIGSLLTFVELRAFLSGQYEQRGPIGPRSLTSEQDDAQVGNVGNRRFQFGLRTMLLLMWFTSLALSWWYCIPIMTKAVRPVTTEIQMEREREY